MTKPVCQSCASGAADPHCSACLHLEVNEYRLIVRSLVAGDDNCEEAVSRLRLCIAKLNSKEFDEEANNAAIKLVEARMKASRK